MRDYLLAICFALVAWCGIVNGDMTTTQMQAKEERPFRRKPPIHRNQIDSISYEQGLEYLNYIKAEYPDLLAMINTFRQNDSFGDPVLFDYPNIGQISPITLRNIKIAGDLRRLYGDKLKFMNIVEIGSENGSLCKIISDLCGFSSYTLIDTNDCNESALAFLSAFRFHVPVTFIDETALEQTQEMQYDLVISNFKWASLPQELRSKYLSLIIRTVPYGYMNCECALHQFSENSPVDQLIAALYAKGSSGDAKPEKPLTAPNNTTIWWHPKEDQKPTVLKSNVSLKPLVNGQQQQSAVTYDFSGGRFGDNLVAYFHAKWVARMNGWPFLYRHFAYADLLKIEQMDYPLSSYVNYKQKVRISKKEQIPTAPNGSLIVIPYFSESKFEYDMLRHEKEGMPFFVVDWEDPEFHKEVVESLTPTVNVSTLKMPPGYITVAMHVRRGGAWETYAEGARGYPLKFTPDSYYISELKRITRIFPNQPIYAYIFTDDLHPENIAKTYSDALNNPNIVIDWGHEQALPEGSPRVLHDFYSMGHFDCMIRCMSNFSLMGSQLGEYDIMTTPVHAYFQNGQVVIDQMEIKFKGQQ